VTTTFWQESITTMLYQGCDIVLEDLSHEQTIIDKLWSKLYVYLNVVSLSIVGSSVE
jgi:hypothetical protein